MPTRNMERHLFPTKFIWGTIWSVAIVVDNLTNWGVFLPLFFVASQSPWDAYILHRSVKTLALRMDRHSENALRVAQFLQDHPKVSSW